MPMTSLAIQASMVVTSYRSPDVVLATRGNVAASGEDLTFQQRMNLAGLTGTSFYGGVPRAGQKTEPTIGVAGGGGQSLSDQIVNCFEHQCGAIAVTGASLDISVGFSLLTAASATGNVIDPVGPFFIPVTTGLGALTAASWDSTIEMGTYDYQYGSNATPLGALEHGGQGILQGVDWLAEHI
jgi:hypothetical protein